MLWWNHIILESLLNHLWSVTWQMQCIRSTWIWVKTSWFTIINVCGRQMSILSNKHAPSRHNCRCFHPTKWETRGFSLEGRWVRVGLSSHVQDIRIWKEAIIYKIHVILIMHVLRLHIEIDHLEDEQHKSSWWQDRSHLLFSFFLDNATAPKICTRWNSFSPKDFSNYAFHSFMAKHN